MKRTPKQPMQPVVLNIGVARFQPNEIIRWAVNEGRIDLNEIASMHFTNADRRQLAQLIGYSIDGYGELPYVSDRAYEDAKAAQAKLESNTRITRSSPG